MEKIAVFPGSFDPITVGHQSIINRAINIFDKIIVAVGENSEKANFFSIEQRLKWIELVFANEDRISVSRYSGLTVDFCKKVNARFILRGLRTSADFEFERSIGQVNKKLYPEIETDLEMVYRHSKRLKQLIGDLEIMDSDKEESYWRKIREFQWLPDDNSLIKIPLTPKLVPKLDEFLEANNTIRRYSVGANIAWVAWPQQVDNLDHFLKGENLAGLTILGSTDQIRIGAWEPGVFYQRVKKALDPSGKWAKV